MQREKLGTNKTETMLLSWQGVRLSCVKLVFYVFSPRGSNRVPNYRLPTEIAAFFPIVVRYIILVLLCIKKGIGKSQRCPKKQMCRAFF